MNTGHVYNVAEKHLHETRCLGRAALAVGTTATNIAIGAAFIVQMLGVLYTRAVSAAGLAVEASVQAADTVCYYLVCLDPHADDADQLSLVKGVDDVDELPRYPDGRVVIGIMRVETDGVAFTAGTTALNAIGVTTAFVNTAVLTDAPPSLLFPA